MRRNACGRDRLARLVVGAVLVVVTLLGHRGRGAGGGPGTVARWQVVAAYAAGELLVSWLTQWCPVNAALGINSCARPWTRAIRDVFS